MLYDIFSKPMKPRQRQKLMTNEQRVIAEVAAQCYLHEYDTEQASNSLCET